MKKWKIAVVGASGMVGGELIELLEKRKFPVESALFFSSGKNKSFVKFKGKKYECSAPDLKSLCDCEIVFFVSNEEVSEKYAFRLAEKGIWCIDDSSRFRMDKRVPLIIPEINGELINEKNKVIAGPNCTLTPLAVGCALIHKKLKIKEIRVSTYQAVSGAGRKALNSLFEESSLFLKKSFYRKSPQSPLPHPIAFNIFPQVGSFDYLGYSGEENKVSAELKKIWNSKNIKISVTAVRVPVVRTHCLSAWIKTEKNWTISSLEKIFLNTPGAKYLKNYYSTPLNTAKTCEVYVSRLRPGAIEKEFAVWLAGDNLYKGAALNSVQIAEEINRKYAK
ncbi:MAG: aspartate-semialdehyde dehydrogenase [Elusimicrobia bacterium]|nr:aspartate-semialdehyde dehydrogenase [Elusimicrobiota bacterium]